VVSTWLVAGCLRVILYGWVVVFDVFGSLSLSFEGVVV